MNKFGKRTIGGLVALAMAAGVGVAIGVGSKKAVAVEAAENDLVYTLTTQKSTGNTAYGSTYDVTIDGIKWNAPGNQNFDNYWRIGGKNLNSVERVLKSKDPINTVIKKVTISHSGISNANFSLNSVSLTVASDAAFENVIETRIVTPSVSTTAGTFDIQASTASKWEAGSYYKFGFVCSNSTSTNYGLNLSSIAFYEGYTPAAVPTKGTLAITPVAENKLEVGQTGTFNYTLTGGSQNTLSSCSWRSSNSSVVEITNSSTGAFLVKNAGSATIYLSGTDADAFEYEEVSYSLTTELGAAGSRYNPFNVATALTKTGSVGVYTAGIVSSIKEISTSFGNATYFISDDGSTSSDQLEIFRGKYLENASFTSNDQLQVGDRVIVYGDITSYNDTIEYDAGNYLVSLKSEPRLTLSPSTIEVTVGTNKTVTATPSSFDDGAITYSFDSNECATLSHDENVIEVHGVKAGSYTFTVTGKAGGIDQATAQLVVTVVDPYPMSINKTGYTTFTDTQTFADGTGSVTITYSDGNKATKHLGDPGVKLLISDVEVSADTSTVNYLGANSAKITYTEGGHIVETNNFTLNVNAELAVTSFEGVPEYLIIDSEDPAHSATVTVNYKSLNGAPELSVVSSNPAKLPVTFDESNNVYDANSKTGVATFGITAGSTVGQYSVTVSATYGNRTESKSFSINVRGEAPAASEGSYQKALELSDLENGNYVIAANTGSVFGMTRSLSGGKYAFSSALTVTDNKISSATGDEISFYLTVSGTGSNRTATIKNLSNNKYVAYSSKTDLSEGDNGYEWTVTKQSSAVFRFTSGTAGRVLAGRADTTNKFGGYSEGNINGTEYFDLTLFKYVEPAASSFDLVNGFVTNYMHMNDVSIGNGSDTGACKGNSGYYLTAKRAWNTMVEGYEGDDLQTVFSTSFEDAYARYNAWAVAMNDAAPFDGNDNVVSFIRNALVNRALDASTSLPLVVTVAALGTAAAAGFFLFQRKRKEF